MDPQQPEPRRSRYARIRHRLVTPELIYGTIISSAVIAVADDDQSDLDVFGLTLATMLVFWAAHVFAVTVASHGMRNGREIPLPEAFRSAIDHSYGLLLAAIIPLLFLILGAIGLIEEYTAYYLSLSVGTVVLAFLGWMAFADRGSKWPIRLLGAVGTAIFGIIVIELKSHLH
jgi:hypothetical protein